MTTLVRVDRDATGRVRADLRSGELSPRVLDRGPDSIRVALVATVALLLAGDDVGIEVEVGPGLHLDLVETSGTVAYHMRGGSASWRVAVHLHADASLAWAGLPFVVSDGAAVDRRTSVTLDAGARAMLRETVVLGRSGEIGGDLTLSTDVWSAGRPLLREDLDLTRGSRDGPAVLAGARCLDQLTLLGFRAELDGPDVLQLAGPGTIVRTATDHLHERPLTELSRHVQRELLRRSGGETPGKQSVPTILPIGCTVRGDHAVRAVTIG